MAIKAIINNTEKEIEQIKNSDEQDIDYVYSRIGDTEVEGEPSISIKSIGGNLADYRIYGNTVGGESVGDRTGNLFDEKYENIPENLPIYEAIYVGDGYFTLSTTAPLNANSAANLFLMSGDVQTGASTAITGVWTGHEGTVESVNGYITVAYRYQYGVDPRIYNTMLNSGSTPLPYEPYGYKVPVTVEGKNLLQNTVTRQTINGVTFTVNSDGSVTCNGTATAHASLRRDIDKIPVGIYKLSGCPKNGAYNTYRLDVRNSSDVVIQYNSNNVLDTGNGCLFNSTNAHHVEIRIENGYTCDNLTFYPMVRKADIEDDTYEPYHAPVTTPIYLPEQIRKIGDEAEYIDYSEQKLHRVRKNLLQNQAVDREIEGVTFTVNSDGSITCNGTASDNTNSGSISSSSLPAGSYYLNGTPSGGSLSTYYMYVACYTESEIILYNDVGDGVSFTIDNSCNINVRIAIKSGCTCNNLTFYPMIRKADITDDTYEPYIVNTEVNTNLPALSTIKGTNILSVNTSIQPSNIYIKDSFDYKKVFTATRTIEDELPLNYKNIEDNDSTLSNYRIYGQTSRNLFDMKKFAELCYPRYASVTFADNTLSFTPITVDAYVNDICSEGDTVPNQYRPSCINVLPSTTYTISMSSAPKCYISWISSSFKGVSAYTRIPANQSSYTFTTPKDCTKLLFRLGKQVTNIGDTFTISNIMLNSGSTPIPYEPYGESVGDRTGNLFDKTKFIQTNIVAQKDLVLTDDPYTILTILPCNPNTKYTISKIVTNRFVIWGCTDYPRKDAYCNKRIISDNDSSSLTFKTGNDDNYLLIMLFYQRQPTDPTIEDVKGSLMFNYGAALSYEPYGYKVPVTVSNGTDTLTTPIYLPEQIRKVGDEAEYIDYAEQKQHKVRKNYFQSSDFEAGAIFTGQGWKDLTYQNSKTPPGQTDLGGVVFDTTRKRSTNLITIIGTYTISIADGWEFGIVMFPNDKNSGEQFIYNTEPVTISNCTFAIQLKKTDTSDISSANISDYKIMLNKGSTPLPYEPYIENTELDVTLPALPTLTGTNVLSVGTEVQPSGVEIKGHIK